MKHKTKGLVRSCTANDMFLTSQGIQCGNCLAVEEPREAVDYSDYAKDKIYQWHNNNGTCTCKICWPINREKFS